VPGSPEDPNFPDRRTPRDLISYRLGQAEKNLEGRASQRDLDKLERDVAEDFARLLQEVDGMKKAMWAVAGSWLVGSGMFLLAVLEFARG
jgi:hypothetical protein